MRFSTRSLTAWDSMASSLSVVKVAHSGFWPVSSVFRYEIRYLGIGDHLLSVLVSPCLNSALASGFAAQLERPRLRDQLGAPRITSKHFLSTRLAADQLSPRLAASPLNSNFNACGSSAASQLENHAPLSMRSMNRWNR